MYGGVCYNLLVTQHEAFSHWHNRALSELKAAEILFQNDDQLHGQVLFHCRLTIELALKAAYIQAKDKRAPFTHDINELASLLKDSWTEEEKDAFDELSAFAILARYGDEEWFEENATKENAEVWLSKTKDFVHTLLP